MNLKCLIVDISRRVSITKCDLDCVTSRGTRQIILFMTEVWLNAGGSLLGLSFIKADRCSCNN